MADYPSIGSLYRFPVECKVLTLEHFLEIQDGRQDAIFEHFYLLTYMFVIIFS